MPENIIKLVPRIRFEQMGSGDKPLATIENLEALLDAYQIKVFYNPISKDIDIQIPGQEMPFENKVEYATSHITSLTHEHKMASGWVYKFLIAIAYKNRRNPVADWIGAKPWDGVSRLDDFFDTVTSEDEDLKKNLMRRWMISAIGAAYEPHGISAGGMLVFQGDQYLGKTNWFKNLVPREMRAVVKDGFYLDIKNKDNMIYCFSRWLVELGELQATFKSSGMEPLKAFITADMDMIRVPYGQNFSSFPRSTIFFGSVNDKNFLFDQTGNRRFWTVSCKAINHTHGLDMQQIWAEFKVLYDTGERWHLDKEEFEALNNKNLEHEFTDPMLEKLAVFYDWECECDNWKTATQVLEEMGYRTIGKSDATKCGTALGKLNGGLKRTIRGTVYRAVPPKKA